MGWLLLVVCAIVLVIALKSRNRKINIHDNTEVDSTATDIQIMPLLEIDQSVIEPNRELLDTFFRCFVTIGMSSIAIREDFCCIIITLADALGRTHQSIENRNMISIHVSFLNEILEFRSFPDFDSRMRMFYKQNIDHGVNYDTLVGIISGDPNKFLIQLGKVIKNTYPKIVFGVSLDGTIDDGSNGFITISTSGFNLERR